MKKLVFKLRSYIDYLLWKISSSKYLNGSENIRDYQLKKINEQLENAFNNNELYKKYYFECGIQPDFKLHTLEDIKKLPILKKKHFKIAASNGSLVSKNFKIKNLIPHHTTGSTGNPTQVYTYELLDKIRGRVMKRTWYNAGKLTYKRILKVWRSKAYTKEETNRINFGLLKIYEILDYEKNKFHKEEKSKIEEIIKFNPNIIRGYVSALYDLGKKIKNHKLNSLECIIASAEYLSPIIWEKLEEYFNAPVINLYGGTEAPAIAVSKVNSKFLFINEDLYFIELLDSEYNQSTPGNVSKIILTDLHNKAFPLIRYEIGDLAIADDNFNNLNSAFRYFVSVEGRSNDIFIFKDGSKLYSHFWHIIFREEEWIDTFQVIQEDLERITINLVLSGKKNNLEELRKKIYEKIPNISIDYKIIENIPLGPGGKELAIYSRVNNDFNKLN